MRKLLLTLAAVTICAMTASCTHVGRYEQIELIELKHKHGISVENPQTELWEPPKSPVLAAVLNILPGVGNFYLCNAESTHCAYGALNLLLWPLSVLWAIPDGAISANAINEKDLLHFYKYNNKGKDLLKAKSDSPEEIGDSLKGNEGDTSKESSLKEGEPPQEAEAQGVAR